MFFTSPLFCSRAEFTLIPIYAETETTSDKAETTSDKAETTSDKAETTSDKAADEVVAVSKTEEAGDPNAPSGDEPSLSYNVTITPLISPLDILADKEYASDVITFEEKLFEDFYEKNSGISALSSASSGAATAGSKPQKKISSLKNLIRQIDLDLMHFIDDQKIDEAVLFNSTWEQNAPKTSFKEKYSTIKNIQNPQSSLLLSTRFKYIVHLSAKFKTCFDSFDLSTLNSQEGEDKSENVFTVISKARGYLLNIVKSNFVDNLISNTEDKDGDSSRFNVQISRSRSLKFRHRGEKDVEGEWTVFGQIFRQLHQMHPKVFRTSRDRIWNTTLLGEKAHDAGGPYRESWTQMMDDVKSDYMLLLKPSPNLDNSDDRATRKEAYIVNPNCARSDVQLEMLVFLGKLFGHAIRSNMCLDIVLAPLVWKLIVDDDVNLDDLITVDYYSYSRIKSFRSKCFNESDYLDEMFTALSYGGEKTNPQEVELIPGGSEICVLQDVDRYCDLLERFKLSEMRNVCKAIRRGLDTQIPPAATSILSWYQLEEKVCGAPTIDCKLLKQCCQVSHYSQSDNIIKWFWEIMEKDFSDENRRAFIRFAWGRSRIPSKGGFQFKITGLDKSPPDEYLPESHTCFFTVDFPRYTSKKAFFDKLLYACHNCTAIDNDGGAHGVYED